MSDEKMAGHVEAAEILNTRQDEHKEAQELAKVIPDGFRVVEIGTGDGHSVERETEHPDKWVSVARFTEEDAKYESANEIHKETSDEYRCVVDHTSGEVWLEVLVSDE